MSEKTHYKKLNDQKYVGGFDFDVNEERNVTISKVEKEKVTDQNGNDEFKIVLHFKEGKPMIMNATNLKMLTKLLKSPMIEDWVGNVITLHTKKVTAFGEVHDAIRIKAKLPAENKPKSLPILKADTKEWDGAVDYITGMATTKEWKELLSAMSGKYKISAGSQKTLNEIYEKARG